MNRFEKIAKNIRSFDENWEKGYSIGTDVAFKVRWGIGDVIQIAAYIGEKSGVPELVSAAKSIKRSEDKEIVEGVSLQAGIAQRILNKVKRYGVMGMAGAMAGMTEDANAHSAAGIVYALGDTLMAKYGTKVASDIIAEGEWDMSPAKPKFHTLFEKFNGLRWSLRDYGAFERPVADTFWQIMKRAAKKMSFPNMKPEDWGLDKGMKKWPYAAQKLTEAAKNIFGQLKAAPEEEIEQIANYYGEERLAKIAAEIAESPRAKITSDMEEALNEMHLNSPYLSSGTSSDKKYRYIIFAKPRTVDGEVRVYNPKFIMVSWQTAFRNLPHRDKRIFSSALYALAFIKLAFVDLDADKAMEIPHR